MNLFFLLLTAFIVLGLLPQLAGLWVNRMVRPRNAWWGLVAAPVAAAAAFLILGPAAANMWLPEMTVYAEDGFAWYEISPQIPGGLVAHLVFALLLQGVLFWSRSRAAGG